MAQKWRAGIWHGVPERGASRWAQAQAQDVIVEAIHQGTEDAVDMIEKRYGGQMMLVTGALLLGAASVAILAILALSKEV